MTISHVKLKVRKKQNKYIFTLNIVSNIKLLNYSQMSFQNGKNIKLISIINSRTILSNSRKFSFGR